MAGCMVARRLTPSLSKLCSSLQKQLNSTRALTYAASKEQDHSAVEVGRSSRNQEGAVANQRGGWPGSSLPTMEEEHFFRDEQVVAEICFSRPFKESELKASLSKFLAPAYVSQAFDLPPTSYTIWNVLARDMDSIGAVDPFPATIKGDLLPFLRIFFSSALVDVVEESLQQLAHSFLGGEYALRGGKVALAKTLLDDIFKAHVVPPDAMLNNFFGACVEERPADGDVNGGGAGDGQWEMVTRQRHNEEESVARLPPGGKDGNAPDRGGMGGGGRGGRRRVDSIFATHSSRGFPFEKMIVVNVDLSTFETPPNSSSDKSKRVETLAQRSFAFLCHENVDEGVDVMYNPIEEEEKIVRLYHGTQSSSLESFKRKGIASCSFKNENEFSASVGFYLTNSLQQAFEHPVHTHPGKLTNDPLSVLVFNVDIKVLHGEKVSQFGDKFKVYWFPDDEQNYDDWHSFVIGNLKKELPRHDYDIVIGPCCIPIPGDVKKLVVNLPGGASLTQVACCSKRARDWMGSCVTKVYCEI